MPSTRIAHINFLRATSPLSRPIADSTHQLAEIAFLIARIELASGVTGDGYLLAFHYSPAGIAGALHDIEALVLDREVYATGELIRDFEREAEYFGSTGLQRWALAVVNIAMWDAWAKTLEQPIWRLLGTHARRVPLYGSGGWLSYSIEELLEEATGYVRRGFRGVKVKVGSPDMEADLERLARVREAAGPAVNVMMDANQGLRYPAAAALARAAARYNIHWFEEPLPHTDFAGYEALRRTSGMALAMGEREYDTLALRELAARNALDLWQPDIVRLGGVEGWRASAALAYCHHIPVLPHYYKEYDVPLLCTVPGGYGCESFDWVDGLLDYPIVVRDGYAYPHERPGWGFSFRDAQLTELA